MVDELVGVILSGCYESSEVTDAVDSVALEEQSAHLSQVQPLVRSMADATEIEVEAINVDVGDHRCRT